MAIAIRNRKLIRLSNYNYSQTGMYFVTICVKNREYLLGEIDKHVMHLSEIGEIAQKCWLEIPNHFPNVSSDRFIIMPNHIHGILEIINPYVGNKKFCSLPNRKNHSWQTLWSRSLSSAIRGFKIGVTKWCIQNDFNNFSWQKSFHDRIIRSETELNKLREYIQKNPRNWEQDQNNCENTLI